LAVVVDLSRSISANSEEFMSALDTLLVSPGLEAFQSEHQLTPKLCEQTR
jgi:hypothetical protein